MTDRNAMRDERRAKLLRELDEIEQKLDDLKIPTSFRSGATMITAALKAQANAGALNAIANKLKSFKKDCPISEEAFEWLDAACANLDQFSAYCDYLVDRLYDRKEEIERELDSFEPTQSEMEQAEKRAIREGSAS